MKKEILQFSDKSNYDAWELQQQNNLDMPIIGIDSKSGVPQPQKQQTVRYSDPVFHPDKSKGDNRIVTYADDRADKIGRTIITEEEAKARGWFKDDSELL